MKKTEGISSVHIGFGEYENPIEIIITFFKEEINISHKPMRNTQRILTE